MTRIKRIYADLIREDPLNRRRPRSNLLAFDYSVREQEHLVKNLLQTFTASLLMTFLVLTMHIPLSAQKQNKFEIVETTIVETQQAIRSGKITCRQLVEGYIKRINAYDQPTRLNAIVVINPEALADADKLDQEFKRTGKMRPLHGIAVIVKDNYDTKDLQTTGGSLAMKGFMP